MREKTLVVFTSDNGGHTYSTNAPFRGAKASIWEGGTRVPCMVRWSGGIREGSTAAQVAVTMDWTATFRRLAGIEPVPIGEDGIDLTPILTESHSPVERTLFWRRNKGPVRKNVEEARAVWQGKWKLIEQKKSGEQLLFDLQSDPGETANRIAEQPDLAKKLVAGKKYPIRNEHHKGTYESTADFKALLLWQSPSLPTQTICFYTILPARRVRRTKVKEWPNPRITDPQQTRPDTARILPMNRR